MTCHGGTSHSDTEFALEDEIMDGWIPAMFWWDDAISGANDKVWVMHGHDESESNSATIIAAIELVM